MSVFEVFLVQMRENTDQKNSEYGHLWRSTRVKGVSRTCQTSIIELYAKIADRVLIMLMTKTKNSGCFNDLLRTVIWKEMLVIWAPVDTGRKLNVHKTFRTPRLLNVLCTFNLHPVSTGSDLAPLLNFIYNSISHFLWKSTDCFL